MPKNAPQPSDAINEARAEAISELFKEHNRALVNFLLTRMGSEAEAREVAQEAYVRLLQLDQPDAVGFLRWTLFRIAKGLAIDRHRQRSARERLDGLQEHAELDLSSPTERSALAADELLRLQAALHELPSKCQRAFLMHRFRDMSVVEIAKDMRLSDRMIRKYIERALKYCRLRVEGVSRDDAARQAQL